MKLREQPTLDELVASMKDVVKLDEQTANDLQVGGTHYKDKPIQPWDFIASNNLDFFQGNIVKYTVRWRDKGGLQDLEKALHYLQKYIEVQREALHVNETP